MRREPDRRHMLWIAAAGGAVLLGILFVALMAPSPAPSGDAAVLRPAADAAAPGAVANDTKSDGGGFSLGGGQAFSLAVRLGLVAVILGVSVVGLRWWGKKTSGPKSVTGFLRVVDTLAISNGRSIHLVALGDRVIAVGATQQQLTLLNELAPEEADRVFAAVPRDGEQPLATFAAQLFESMRGPARRRGPRRNEIAAGDRP